MSSKFFPWLVVLIFVLLIGAIYFGKKANTSPPSASIILFVGDGCPHCEKVEEYVKANDRLRSVPFETREVFNDKKNLRLMQNKIATCASGEEITGVPFLWADDGATCLVGDIDIINYFNEKIGK